MLQSEGVNAGARLDRLPIGRFHRRMLLLISSGGALDAYDVYLAGGVLAAVKASGFGTLQQAAAFLSATGLGMLIGAALAGHLGDHHGRRYSYQFNLWLFGFASLVAALSPSMDFLICARLVMGIGLGAEFVVAAGTLGEFIPPRERGRWASIMGLLTSSGLFVSTAIGYFVIPFFGWRAMFVIGAVAALVIALLRKRMPESPRWLESKGLRTEAEAILSAIEEEVERETGRLPPPASRSAAPRVEAPFLALLRTGLCGRLLVAATVTIAVNTAVYGFVTWLPTFLVEHGRSVSSSLGIAALMSIGSVAGSLAGIAIADRVPRRAALVASAIAVLAFAFLYIGATGSWLPVAGFLLIASIYLLSNQGMYSYVPELFPTAYRLRGTGVAGTCARAVSIATPYFVILLDRRFGLVGVLMLIGATLLAMIAGVILLKVEPSRRSLDEI